MSAPYYDQTVLLAPLDGINASVAFLDHSKTQKLITPAGGAAVSTTQTLFGLGMLRCDGADDRLIVSPHADLALGTVPFCVEFFVSPINGGGGANYARLLQIGSNGTAGGVWIIRNYNLSPLRLLAQVYTGTSYVDVVPPPSASTPNGVFAHVALTRDASNVWRLFLGGALIASNTYSGAGNNLTQSTVYIGANQSGAEAFNGYFGQVRIVRGDPVYTEPFTPPAYPFAKTLGQSIGYPH